MLGDTALPPSRPGVGVPGARVWGVGVPRGAPVGVAPVGGAPVAVFAWGFSRGGRDDDSRGCGGLLWPWGCFFFGVAPVGGSSRGCVPVGFLPWPWGFSCGGDTTTPVAVGGGSCGRGVVPVGRATHCRGGAPMPCSLGCGCILGTGFSRDVGSRPFLVSPLVRLCPVGEWQTLAVDMPTDTCDQRGAALGVRVSCTRARQRACLVGFVLCLHARIRQGA